MKFVKGSKIGLNFRHFLLTHVHERGINVKFDVFRPLAARHFEVFKLSFEDELGQEQLADGLAGFGKRGQGGFVCRLIVPVQLDGRRAPLPLSNTTLFA